MSFFKNLFAKKNYSNMLDTEDNECSHCHQDSAEKLKKCQECGCRNICKTCYKHKDLILCKTCDDSYIKWANQLQGAKIQNDKQQKYGLSGTKTINLL